ncbi:FAS1-like dehydratase domain-containing protein [Streptodolium elevatio]|uniref:MaoC family dehydratase N-terminal domain-containing protein n=1 Tax=Streptodolium elevatio TaxID=3157996 RepID=A0ABV3DN21_9ACTN
MTIDTDTDTTALEAQLQECVARGTKSVVRARHAVNAPMLDIWADALGDPNPVYRDVAAAAATGRTGIIAPPTMIQAWTMPQLSALAGTLPQVPGYAPYLGGRSAADVAADKAASDAGDNPAAAVHRLLTAHGYTARAATRCRQVYHREAQVGDHLSCESVLTTVSERKNTAIGAGYFVTTRMSFRDQDDADVATVDWTVLCFRTPDAPDTSSAGPAAEPAAETAAPAEAAAEATAEAAAEPVAPAVATGRSCLPLKAVPSVGDTLPTTVIPITPTFVIATAFATQDFYAAHHDTDWTRESLRRPGIFTNILATTGLVGGVVTDWGGPATRLLEVDLKLLAPNHTGDTLKLDGEVTEVGGEDGDSGGEVLLRVAGWNSLGPHVLATVRAQIPA